MKITDILVAAAFIPVIKMFISNIVNLTSIEIVLFGLVFLFTIIALLMSIIKSHQ